MKRSVKIAVTVAGLLAFIAIAGTGYYRIMLTQGPNGATYWYACGISSKCYRASSKSEIDVIMEGRASCRQINPQESLWGYQYRLTNGEYMMQYLVKNVEPIDIVYSKDDRVVNVFESYE